MVFDANPGTETLELTGWTVRDEADHVYAFPSGFTLDAGASVTLHTGSGTDTATNLYWGSESAIWNNGGDTVIVKNASAVTVATKEYSG